jgi:hypothetical protein
MDMTARCFSPRRFDGEISGMDLGTVRHRLNYEGPFLGLPGATAHLTGVLG